MGLSAVQLNRKLDEKLRGESRWKGLDTSVPFVPDVRRSARLSSPSTALLPGLSMSWSIFKPVDFGPAKAAEDARTRLVVPCGRLAVGPLLARNPSAPPPYVTAPTPCTPAPVPYAGVEGGRSSSGGGGGFCGSNVPSRARSASE